MANKTITESQDAEIQIMCKHIATAVCDVILHKIWYTITILIRKSTMGLISSDKSYLTFSVLIAIPHNKQRETKTNKSDNSNTPVSKIPGHNNNRSKNKIPV